MTPEPPADRPDRGSGSERRSRADRARSTRTKARKRALDILFEAELRGRPAAETLAERTADADPPVREYTATLVGGVQDHQQQIDERITAELAKGWTLTRMPRVDRAALRIAVYEIDHRSDVPDAVAVSEAVELVGELSTDESPAFVNGLLGSVVAGKSSDAGAGDTAGGSSAAGLEDRRDVG